MIKDPCKTCGSTDYYYWRLVVPSNPGESSFEQCSNCCDGKIPNLSPDVYFDARKGANQTDPNLCGRDGVPIPFSSKREKAAIMKSLKLTEGGDKKHGSRNFDKKAAEQWKTFNNKLV